MLRHLRAVVLCPGVVTVVVPALLLWWSGDAEVGWGLTDGPAVLAVLLGVALIGLGLALVVWTITLFATIGEGTLAPWDPTSRLVVQGPYRHVRHPMISGVVLVLLGEAALLGSFALLVWSASVFAVNAVYLPLVEERGLRRRFGEEYDVYCANVARWRPRLRPWTLAGNAPRDDLRQPGGVDVPARHDADDAPFPRVPGERRGDR
jgi:protein-S-isoprenylcysteine O-methyltransferase Ste14